MLNTLIRVGAAGAGLALLCLAMLAALGSRWHHGFLVEGLTVVAGAALAAAGGYALMKFLRVEELVVVEGLVVSLRRRLGGR